MTSSPTILTAGKMRSKLQALALAHVLMAAKVVRAADLVPMKICLTVRKWKRKKVITT